MISIFGTFDEDCLGRCCSKPENPPEEKVLHSLIQYPILYQICYLVVLVLIDDVVMKNVLTAEMASWCHEVSENVLLLSFDHL